MTLSVDRPLLYPDSDGQPMADNTRQFQWIVLIKENLEWIFADDPQVFIAGDLLWYPTEGNPKIRVAPDVLVVFGRPKGDRGSYKQWEEDNIPPQVVFEILSPGNTLQEMLKKQQFYDRHGVEEYYIYDPDGHDLAGLQRIDGTLTAIEAVENWTSPRLGIRFEFTPEALTLYSPDGERFLTTIELGTARQAAQAEAEAERERADTAEAQLQTERQRAERLAAQLRALGVEPEE